MVTRPAKGYRGGGEMSFEPGRGEKFGRGFDATHSPYRDGRASRVSRNVYRIVTNYARHSLL